MKRNNGCLTEDDSEDINGYPLSVRFSARRALLNAEVKAKITDRTYKPEPIICQIPNHAIPTNYHLKLRKVN